MECNYMNWLTRKDAATQNAQAAAERQDAAMFDYWKNQAAFCQRMLDKMLNSTAQKWLDCNWFSSGTGKNWFEWQTA